VQSVVLTGADSALGRRVVDLLHRDPDVERVVVIDRPSGPDDPELKRRFEGATSLVHLDDDAPATRAVLDAAGAIGIRHAVVLSSATVYGAWPTNAVPLTEQAPLRPNPELSLAVRAAERERLTGEWKAAHPSVTAAVLRPAVPVAEDDDGWLARSLRAAAGPVDAGDDPPGQFVHLDDLASAIDHARRLELDGPYNVAPDGWIASGQLRALGGGPRVRLPDRIAARAAGLRWQLLLATSPPGLAEYARHPWVVANDRLRATGWAPRHTNEDAYVAGHRASPWATLSPHRRQQLALGAAAAGAVAAAAGAAAGIRALARSRSRK
jgi:nucleoside-diphosphate-sugar epimerase